MYKRQEHAYKNFQYHDVIIYSLRRTTSVSYTHLDVYKRQEKYHQQIIQTYQNGSEELVRRKDELV